jgi:putative exosortase-associated protein (TIGR04073 family)
MGQIRWGLISLLVVLAAGAPVGWTESSSTAPKGPDRVEEFLGRHQLHPAFGKLGRGVANTLFGWLELPVNLHDRYDARNTAGSLFTGIAYGVVKGLARTGVGVYETVTFLLPYPEDFAPILPTLGYFQREGKRRPLLFE